MTVARLEFRNAGRALFAASAPELNSVAKGRDLARVVYASSTWIRPAIRPA